MFLQDPPPSALDLHFSVLGIPVRVSPWFWGVSLLLGLDFGPEARNEPAEVIIWVVAVFVSILVHELGHAFAARACGWPPRITLYGFGGFASYSPSYHDSKRQIGIAAAGPAAGFLLAGILIGVLVGFGYVTSVFGFRIGDQATRVLSNPRLVTLINDLLVINIFWGVVNLMPVIPLDGGRISAEILATFDPAQGHRRALMLSTVVGAAIAIGSIVYLRSFFIAIMFGFLAYQSYLSWQGRYMGGRW